MKRNTEARKRIEEIWDRESIAEKGRLVGIHMFPPATSGRGKRRRDDHLFVDAVCAFLGKDGEHLVPEMLDAFKTGNMGIFSTIAEAKAYVDCIPHSGFSRRVMEVLRCKIVLRKRLGRNPTKLQIKESVSFKEETSQRWTELFKAAGLGWLPNGKPERKPKKHGDKYTLRR